MCAGVAQRRQGGHAGVRVALTAADHLAEAVVCPDFNDVLRQVQTALLVQLHGLAVEIRAADGVWVVLFDQCILLPDEAGDERAALFGGVVLRVILPERLVALSPEADVPYRGGGFLPVNGILPQGAELFRVQAELGFQLRVGLHEHFGTQRLGVVVGDDQPHIGGKVVVAMAVFARAGNDQIAAQAQQRFKHHGKGKVAAALHLPVGDKRFVIDEPTTVPYPCRFALIGEVLRHSHAVRLDKLLVVPEPEGLHAQKAPADLEQTVHKAQRVSGSEQKRVVLHLQTEALRCKVTVLGKADDIAGSICFGEYGLHIPIQGRDGILNRFCFLTGNDLAVAVENHKSTSLLKKGKPSQSRLRSPAPPKGELWHSISVASKPRPSGEVAMRSIDGEGSILEFYPLIPSVAMPSTIYFWNAMNTMMTGSSEMTDMANSPP